MIILFKHEPFADGLYGLGIYFESNKDKGKPVKASGPKNEKERRVFRMLLGKG